MNTSSPSDDRLLQTLEPFLPIFAEAICVAFARVQLAPLILGEAKRIERSSDMKRATRHIFKSVCDEAAPILNLVEVPECRGFDHIVVNWDECVAIRWGHRKDDGVIARNPTASTRQAREPLHRQLRLYPDDHKTIGSIPLLTLSHTIVNEHTLASVPQGFVQRVDICREWSDHDTEVIRRIAEYEDPGPMTSLEDERVLRQLRLIEERAGELRRCARRIGNG